MKIGHTLDLASDISVNFAVSAAELSEYDSYYMECTLYDGTVVQIDPVAKGDYYYFTLTGLTAVNMNDEIRAILRMTRDGQDYVSKEDRYSIAQYAYSQMDKPNMPESLKRLCADLLRYGAKAQTFKAYRLDALADASMTEAHRAYLSDGEGVTFGNNDAVLSDLPNAPIKWMGKGLSLESKVCLRLVFSMDTYGGKPEDLRLRVCYAGIDGEEKTRIFDNGELYNEEKGLYSFTVDTLLAAELRSIVSAQIYSGETPLSCTLQYSADTYGNNKSGALLELCKALFAYSDSAKAFFAG